MVRWIRGVAVAATLSDREGGLGMRRLLVGPLFFAPTVVWRWVNGGDLCRLARSTWAGDLGSRESLTEYLGCGEWYDYDRYLVTCCWRLKLTWRAQVYRGYVPHPPSGGHGLAISSFIKQYHYCYAPESQLGVRVRSVLFAKPLKISLTTASRCRFWALEAQRETHWRLVSLFSLPNFDMAAHASLSIMAPFHKWRDVRSVSMWANASSV
jgi:hypothetical protein